MGKESWDPEVQLFMPLFEVGREEVGWGQGGGGDKAKWRIWESPELEAGRRAGLEGASQPACAFLCFCVIFSGHIQRKKNTLFPLLPSC